MSKGQRIRVTVFGMEYTLKSEEDPQHIIELANYLNEKMTEISEKSSAKSALKIAILAALNITDDLFTERSEKENLEESISEKCASLREQVNMAVAIANNRDDG